jgi:hypothetical protein
MCAALIARALDSASVAVSSRDGPTATSRHNGRGLVPARAGEDVQDTAVPFGFFHDGSRKRECLTKCKKIDDFAILLLVPFSYE